MEGVTGWLLVEMRWRVQGVNHLQGVGEEVMAAKLKPPQAGGRVIREWRGGGESFLGGTQAPTSLVQVSYKYSYCSVCFSVVHV